MTSPLTPPRPTPPRPPKPAQATFTPRPYQAEAIAAGVKFLRGETGEGNGILVLPTGSGKSVVIANIAAGVEGKTLVLQPSKEILEQNFKKYCSYGFRAGIYSASAGVKFLDTVTFAMIGSVISKKHLFAHYKNVVIDECHLVSSKEDENGDALGMYLEFIRSIEGCRVLGLTATPYRLASMAGGAELRFLTRTRPAIFKKVLYYVQNEVLFRAGYLAKLEYFAFDVVNRSMLQMNSSGTDFTAASVRAAYRAINMPQQTAYWAGRLLAKRKNLLVFCSLVEEAQKTAHLIDGAVLLTGKTEKGVREKMLRDFTSGKIRCIVNVGVLTTGFDYPELETVLLARSTMSLALYYQMVGRVMRPHPQKESGYIVDLGGNIKMFGKIETMQIGYDLKGKYIVSNNGRQLTNVPFTKE